MFEKSRPGIGAMDWDGGKVLDRSNLSFENQLFIEANRSIMTWWFPAWLIRCMVTSLAKTLKTRGEGERTKFGTTDTILRTLGRWKVKKR